MIQLLPSRFTLLAPPIHISHLPSIFPQPIPLLMSSIILQPTPHLALSMTQPILPSRFTLLVPTIHISHLPSIFRRPTTHLALSIMTQPIIPTRFTLLVPTTHISHLPSIFLQPTPHLVLSTMIQQMFPSRFTLLARIFRLSSILRQHMRTLLQLLTPPSPHLPLRQRTLVFPNLSTKILSP
jgi:hypothetical protein